MNFAWREGSANGLLVFGVLMAVAAGRASAGLDGLASVAMSIGGALLALATAYGSFYLQGWRFSAGTKGAV
jgi:hypothetical protein